MATNKERIEKLEAGLGELQDRFSKMELGVAEKINHLEATINKLSEVLLSKHDFHLKNTKGFGEGSRPQFSSKLAKLEFPIYFGDEPTEWLNRVEQFFEYQNTPEMHKVSLAAYHLSGEANQWWQWLHRICKEDRNMVITWELFVEELWVRFGPSEGEEFDEALSKIKQVSSLRDYQKEFERLANRVQGWSQKALVGTFMGGLKAELANGIRMFKPKSLKEVITLARMKNEELSRHVRITTPARTSFESTSSTIKPGMQVKRLSREETQKRRAQGLCFNCDEKFTLGHKCHGGQLLLLERSGDTLELIQEEFHSEP